MRQPRENASYLTLRENLKIVLLLIALTCLYLYPYLLKPGNFNGGGDDAVFANAFWWCRKSMALGQNPFFSTHLFFPEGMSLVFHATTFSNFLLTLPVQLIWGVNEAVNCAYFLTFILTGYFTFLLAYECTRSRSAAMVAVFIFAFSPFHFGQGRAHLHIATLQWLPLYFLMLKRALEKPGIKDGVFAGALFGVILLTDQLQTVCAAVVSMIMIAAALLSVRGERQKLIPGLRQLLVISVTSVLTAGVYLLPLIRELALRRSATKIPPLEHGGANMFSADLLGFLVPGFHRLWGGLFSSLSLGRDSVTYVGLAALVLTGYGCWLCRRERLVRWIGGITLLFWVLSLGIYLHLNGIWEFGSIRIPLPYLYMTDIPLLGENRTPVRFHMITQLGVALLAAYGTRALLERRSATAHLSRGAFTLLISSVILLETLPPRQDPGNTPTPELYREMAADRREYSLLQLPLSRWSALLKNGSGSPASMMYYQTIHGKPIFSGLASRLVPEDLDFKDRILDMLVETSSLDNALVRNKETPSGEQLTEMRKIGEEYAVYRENFLKRYRIGAVVIHPPVSGNLYSRAFLEGFLGRPLKDGGDGLLFAGFL